MARRLLAFSTAILIVGIGIQVTAAQQAGPRAEEVYKNIQVFRGLPADQLEPSMAYMEIALGVHCAYCHTPGQNNEAADTNPRKLVARQMIRMVQEINKSTFGGRNVVSCSNCHRVQPKPSGNLVQGGGEGMPPDLAAAARFGEERPVIGDAPTVEQLINRYVNAAGGAGALAKITSISAKGVHTDYQHIDPEPEDHQIRQVPVDNPLQIVASGMDRRQTVIGVRNGDFLTTYNGTNSWARGGFFGQPGPPRDLRPDERDIARLENAVMFPSQLTQVIRDMRVTGKAMIADHDTFVVTGRTEVLPVVKLYFEPRTGLLSSMLYQVQSFFCCRNWQVFYSDYLFENGLRIPRRWIVTTSRDWFMTYELNEVQLNTAVQDARFARPAAPPAK